MVTPPVATDGLETVVMVVERDREGAYMAAALYLVGAYSFEPRLGCDLLPGMPAVDGMRWSRGLSVGGRGAGPGFMNESS